MAVVNVDLSEYDAIRNRNKELEEQIKELKKINESLKNGTKVILRKETAIEFEDSSMMRTPWGGYEARPKIRRTVESSESYINFEDVRLKVENQMRDEVERSINDHKDAYEKYCEKYSSLDAEYKKKKAELEETCKKKLQEENDKIREEYKNKFAEVERERNVLSMCLNRILSLADIAASDLRNRLFRPIKAIKKLERISDIARIKKVSE